MHGSQVRRLYGDSEKCADGDYSIIVETKEAKEDANGKDNTGLEAYAYGTAILSSSLSVWKISP